MQTIHASGNLGRDPELKTTQNGDKVLSFSVGVQQGWGDRASTNWFRCSVWGKRAETLDGRMFKGTKVFVSGELTIGSYEGKPQYEIRINELDFVPRGDRPASERTPDGSRGAPEQRGGYDDLGDDVPFITSAGMF